MGKIISKIGCDKDGTSENTQWGIVGDTFILGHKIPNSIVFNELINHPVKPLEVATFGGIGGCNLQLGT